MSAEKTPDPLSSFLGEMVIVDTTGWLIYAGRVEAVGQDWLTLADCDVHDHRESNSTRDIYIMEIAKHGVRKNRERVLLKMNEISSVSLLADITVY